MSTPNRAAWVLGLIVLLVMSSGCLGQRALTPEDGIAAVYTTVEVVNRNTATRVEAGLVPVSDAAAILAVTREARLLADAASLALDRGQTEDANSAVLLAIALLDALEGRAAR